VRMCKQNAFICQHSVTVNKYFLKISKTRSGIPDMYFEQHVRSVMGTISSESEILVKHS